MKKIVFILVLSALCSKMQAANIDRQFSPALLQPCLRVCGNNELLKKYLTGWSDIVEPKKFMYAEMIWQRSYTIEKIWVNGKSISQEVKNGVAMAKYRDVALEVMGDDGWELVSTAIRDINAGYELFFYFKKSSN